MKASDTNHLVYVLCQYYNDPDPYRQREIDTCFQQNFKNDAVGRVIHFHEPQTQLPDWMSEHPKFTVVPNNGRLTYRTAVEYANAYLEGQLVCLSNADIFLYDRSPWHQLYQFLNEQPKAIAALSRHEFDGFEITKDPVLGFIHYANAQDAWLFIPQINGVTEIDLPLGTLGCDNAFAYRLVQGGYQPYNFANEYKIIHYDRCRGKRGFNATTYHKNNNKRTDAPEERGQYLLPEFGAYPSLDKVASFLKLSDHERYKYVCDMMTAKLEVKN